MAANVLQTDTGETEPRVQYVEKGSTANALDTKSNAELEEICTQFGIEHHSSLGRWQKIRTIFDHPSNVLRDPPNRQSSDATPVIQDTGRCEGETEQTQGIVQDPHTCLFVFTVAVLICSIGVSVFRRNGQVSITQEIQPTFHCPNDGMPIYVDLHDLHMRTTISAQQDDDEYYDNTTFHWHNTEDKMVCESMEILYPFSNELGVSWDRDCAPHKLSIQLDILTTIDDNDYHKTCSVDLIFEEKPVFGIDLGTTYSCIAFQRSKKNIDERRETQIIVADKTLNRYCIPSAVYFSTNRKISFGVDAMNKLESDPLNVVYDIKRIIGRDPDDDEIKEFKKNHVFKIDDDHKHVFIPNMNESVLFEQILSLLLGYLVESASTQWFGEDEPRYIRDVVVSVPALFHNGQRKAIRSSCHLAGLNPMNLVIEPSVASLAHSYYNKLATNKLKYFLSFDFGGGTLDCSIMRCTGVQCNVLSVHGNNKLGGRDFDYVIRDIIIEKLKTQHGWRRISDLLYSKILSISEAIKIDLTHLMEYEFFLENDDGTGANITITRDEFEQHPKTLQLVQMVLDAVHEASGKKRRIRGANIRMILMIGGSSKLPIIQTALRDEFGKKNREILEFPDTDPQLMVVTGCGIIGGAIAYAQGGTENAKDAVLNQLLVNIIPMSLGFETCVADAEDKDGDGDHWDCGVMKVILPKDTPFGEKQTPQSVCQRDVNDTSLELNLYEGNNYYVRDNHFLQTISIQDIKPREMGICDNVQFSFIVDSNGIATVEATTNPKYGEVKKYKIITHSENAEYGSIQNVNKLKQEMMVWYPTMFRLLKKALNKDLST